jgi:hypothetical protein
LRAADDSCLCWFCKGRDRPLFRLNNSTTRRCVILSAVAIDVQTKGRP